MSTALAIIDPALHCRPLLEFCRIASCVRARITISGLPRITSLLWISSTNSNEIDSTLLATVRNPDVAGAHNEHDLNMLTHVAERTGNM